MNVLFLFDGYRRMDDRTRINLIKKLNKFCNLNIYGPNETDKEFSPHIYNSKNNILKLFNPDVILCSLYNTTCLDWIPDYIYKSNIPVAVVEEDHYTENGLFSFEKDILRNYNKFDLIIRRHYYNEEQNFNSVWWPFAANTDEFFNDNSIERMNLIFFAGSTGTPYYSIRRNAINKLSVAELIESYSRVSNYPEVLRAFTGALSCAGGEIHTPMAKAFETMLSGTALLTNSMYNDKILFGDKKCYFEYKDDCSDIVEQAYVMLSNKKLVAEVTKNAIEIVIERHTDECRIKELYDILKALVAGKDIPKMWGQ